MKQVLAAMITAVLATPAVAGSTPIDLSKLQTKEVHRAATLTPLALSPAGTPAVVLLDLDAGAVVPPHATKSGLRLLTVISGDMSWGDGSETDEQEENIYPAGSVLTVPAGADHWLAARQGPVRIQLIVLDDEMPIPGIQEQMK